MLALLERPGYGSEMTADSHCPHCGSHRQHHATVEEARGIVEQTCPTCGSKTAVWFDKHGTPTYRGCGHVLRPVSIGGVLQLEFKESNVVAFGPGRKAL